MKSHDRQVLHRCDVCFKRFNWKKSLRVHLEVKHGAMFYCEKCLRSFKDKSQFDEHYADSTQELKCYICHENINSECNLKIHTDSHVKEIKPEIIRGIKTENQTIPLEKNSIILTTKDSEILAKFQCQLCSKTFERERHFKAHRMLMHPYAEWKCNFEHCSKTFKAYYLLKQHEMEHADTKSFVCNICNKSFYRPDHLRKHKRIHTKEYKLKYRESKPFKCPEMNCGSSWATNCDLKNHLVSHQTEKTFKCEFCTKPKAFKHGFNLKRHHQEVHLNSKGITKYASKYADAIVFLCSSKKCLFETANLKEVAIHYGQQHGLPKVAIFRSHSSASVVEERLKCQTSSLIQKRFKCDICCKYFKLIDSYGHHKRGHSYEIPIQCTHCPKSFKYPNNLKMHIRKAHRNIK